MARKKPLLVFFYAADNVTLSPPANVSLLPSSSLVQTLRLGLMGAPFRNKRFYPIFTLDYAGMFYVSGVNQNSISLNTINVPGATAGMSFLFWKSDAAYWDVEGTGQYRQGLSAIASDFKSAYGATGKIVVSFPQNFFTLRAAGWVSWHQIQTTQWIQSETILGLEIGVGFK